MHMCVRAAICLWLVCVSATVWGGEQAASVFTLREQLNHEWQHELVFFPVPPQVFGRDNLTLVGPEQEPLAHQWVPAESAPAGKDSVAFFASLPRMGRSDYRLVPGSPVRATDLRVTAAAGTARFENPLVGIHLGGPAAAKDGPITGIRLRSGQWVGRGELQTPWPPLRFAVTVLSRGPIFAEALVTYEFPQYCSWRLRVRLVAGEPVVLVDEEFSLPDGAVYRLNLSQAWNPDQMFHRGMVHDCKTTTIGAVPGARLFQLEAWSPWWGDTPRGNWTSLFRSGGDDLLVIGCREPGMWVEPGRTQWDTTVVVSKPSLSAAFQLRGFARKWLLASLSRKESVTDKDNVAPLPQQYLKRFNDVALDTIKDYVTQWDDRSVRHPRLLVTAAELERFRRNFRVNQDNLVRLRQAKINPWQMDEAVAYLLATSDPELGRRFGEAVQETLQQAVDRFVQQDQLRTHGTAPHHRTPEIMWSAIMADLALSSASLQAEERQRINAQLAYLGYTLAGPGFISPDRGFSANPNMTTSARGMLGLVACTIPTHPVARSWAELAIAEMRRELDEWCDAEGGWLEAPHYMTVSMDALVSLALALRETGFSDTAWEFHPKLRKAAQWLAEISTPPDPRLQGDRHMPEIGNTYLGERTCLPGWLARIWREKDPAFAANMQWMWRAHGMPRTPGIGGAYPGTQGYGHLMLDETIPASPPRWTSRLFPDTGAVLRAHFPGERETYLHYIQGRLHQHYDYDEGSFILWGQGQPLCEDFGYYGRAPAADHSRVDDGFGEQLGNEGRIEEFATGAVDYLRGHRAGWHRQILFVKDDDPRGPNFFVVRDSVTSGRPYDWRVWVAAAEPPAVTANPVRVKGRLGADLVVFFAEPAQPLLATQAATRRSGASGFGSPESTQHALHLKSPSDQPVNAVLYPVGKDQPTPRFTALAGGRGIKVESCYGTDFVLLGLEAFRFQGEGIDFDGKAGAVQVRPRGVRVSLPCRGKVSCQGKVVENPGGGRTTTR
jgi:hypothetical protein